MTTPTEPEATKGQIQYGSGRRPKMTEPKRVLPENIVRRMSKEDREKYGVKTNEEVDAEVEIKLERDLHNKFISFLKRHSLGYYHADPSRKSTVASGLPDFGVFRGSRIIFIEFKIGKNTLSEVQKNRICVMLLDNNTVCVCNGYAEAIRLVSEFFPADGQGRKRDPGRLFL
jgi:hypothetical protein